MPRTVLLLSALLLVSGCDSPVTPEWSLAWSDEFDGAAGALPNTAHWRFDVGTDWGNKQLEYDTDRATNASLDGAGHLLITARRESYQGSAYTSARLTTAGKHEFRHGKVEARMKLPSGQGMWPAFWMLGANYPTAGWPQAGEIDIMEFRGQEPTVIHGTLHGPGYSGTAGFTRAHTLASGRFDTEFHVFTVEWLGDRIDWFVDGELFQRIKRTYAPGTWVFDDDFYVILNLAVGGNYVGAPNAGTPFPQSVVVDYVRVYEAK